MPQSNANSKGKQAISFAWNEFVQRASFCLLSDESLAQPKLVNHYNPAINLARQEQDWQSKLADAAF